VPDHVPVVTRHLLQLRREVGRELLGGIDEVQQLRQRVGVLPETLDEDQRLLVFERVTESFDRLPVLPKDGEQFGDEVVRELLRRREDVEEFDERIGLGANLLEERQRFFLLEGHPEFSDRFPILADSLTKFGREVGGEVLGRDEEAEELRQFRIVLLDDSCEVATVIEWYRRVDAAFVTCHDQGRGS